MNGNVREEQKDQNELSFTQIAVGVVPARTATGFPGVFLYGLDHAGVVWGYEPRGNIWFRVPMVAGPDRQVGEQA